MHLVLEGIDGSGKSTLANNLKESLETKIPVLMYREPSDLTEAGKTLRKLLHEEKKVTPQLQKQMLDLFLKDRLENTKHYIHPFLQKNPNGVIIQDRSWISTAAYQAENPKQALVIAESYLRRKDLYSIDLCFYLRISPDVAMERIHEGKEQKQVFETIKELDRIFENYETIFRKLRFPFRVIRIDAGLPADSIKEVALSILQDME
ncbi:MAG: dTMP kinase [Candidatus Hydrogenedentota bacterium]|nr:MAG: dTMP kinase [Candidatus Hydrogenedentota bacterium]